MIDTRLNDIPENVSIFRLKYLLIEMFRFHGFECDRITTHEGVFYDTVGFECDLTDGKNAYTVASTLNYREIHKAPKKLEGILLDMMANNNLGDKHDQYRTE